MTRPSRRPGTRRTALGAGISVAVVAGVVAAAVGLGGSATGAASPPSAAPRPAAAAAAAVRGTPGTLAFGVHLDWAVDSPAAFRARTGLRPTQYGTFAAYPLTADGRAQLDRQVALVAPEHAALFLTLEPTAGLAAADDAAGRALTAALKAYDAQGVPVLVRFAHEMNGSWYAWGQQPAAYRAAFRRVAAAVHAAGPDDRTVWSPNYGSGYPYTGGPASAAPGSADLAAMDTDHDGRLTMADDPYEPFYPGDDVVDWVGLTEYHWGTQYPWGENEVPAPGKLLGQLTGTWTADGEAALPDFAARYGTEKGKPMALSETAALFNESPPVPGASQREVVGAWLGQVLDPALATRLPHLAMVNWFEQRKQEAQTGTVVDWRVTADPVLRAQLVAGLSRRGTGTPAGTAP